MSGSWPNSNLTELPTKPDRLVELSEHICKSSIHTYSVMKYRHVDTDAQTHTDTHFEVGKQHTHIRRGKKASKQTQYKEGRCTVLRTLLSTI